MSLRTAKGTTLSKVFFAEKANFDWITKLYRNIRRKLNKLGEIVVLAPASLNPSRGNIALYYSGNAEHKARIEKVLDVTFVNDEATVKFSRIKLGVKLLARPNLLEQHTARLARKAA